MSRSKSSSRWLQEHFSDSYVRKSQDQSWRSRAIYKLEQIDQKERLIQPQMCVVELGAAPGGWTQYAAGKLSGKGFLLAVDILEMDAVAGAHILQADFTEESTLQTIAEILEDRKADLVLSDMAPNFTGQPSVDQPRSIYLAELALDMCTEFLNDGGRLLVKTFQGVGFEQLIKSIRQPFKGVKTLKPAASRSRSREVYILATGYKLQ